MEKCHENIQNTKKISVNEKDLKKEENNLETVDKK